MDNLGLKRYTVKLIPHQGFWKEVFGETKEELLNLIGVYLLDIQHIGSTSITGINAKPIIDIAIGVQEISIVEKMTPILENNDFEYMGDGGSEGGHLFVRCSEPEIRTHHIHIVEVSDEQWSNYIYFRDKLNNNKELAKSYSELKKQLAIKYFDNRELYTKSKNDFIKEVLKRE